MSGHLASCTMRQQITSLVHRLLPKLATVEYIVAIVVMVMHFTGLLARYNIEWLMLVLAVTVFPAVIYL